jgi:hypothetical protein
VSVYGWTRAQGGYLSPAQASAARLDEQAAVAACHVVITDRGTTIRILFAIAVVFAIIGYVASIVEEKKEDALT